MALRVREAQGVARGDRWSRRGSLSELSTEDLLHRVDGLREQLREQAAKERALPAEYRTASAVAGGDHRSGYRLNHAQSERSP